MKRILTIFSTFVLFVAVASSCYNRKADQLYPAATGTPCDTAGVSYSATIGGIVSANCAKAGCHDGRTKEGGYDMTNYTGAAAAARDGMFACDLRHQSGCNQMPNDGTILTDCQIKQLIAWANAGAPEN